MFLKQSTQTDIVIGPVWATADGALKSDLAYNASGINCDIYKNGTKADVTLANSAGDGYFRAASGEALYLLTLSTGHTDTLGRLEISLSATGYYMKPRSYMVVPANVWDSMFGSDYLKTEVVEISGDSAAADNLESYCDGTTPIPANVTQLSGDATAADNAESFFDGTGYTGSNNVIGTVTTLTNKTGFSLAADQSGVTIGTANTVGSTGTAAIKTAMEAAGSHLALIKAKTDNLPADPADDSDIDAQLAAIAGYIDTEVASIKGVTDKLDTALEADGGVYRFTANALEQASGTGATAQQVWEYPTRTLTSAGAGGATAQEVWEYATRTITALDEDSTTLDLDATIAAAVPTASAIADAVLDEALSGHTTAGTLGKAVADTLADTNELQTNQGNWVTATGFSTHSAADVVTAIGTGSTFTAVPWNAAWDAEVQSECTDALNAYDPPTKAEMDAAIDAVPTATENADALLNRDMSAVSDTNARSPLNALRALRNKSSINEAGDTYTVTKEDDETTAWEAAVTSSENANPISGIDPT